LGLGDKAIKSWEKPQKLHSESVVCLRREIVSFRDRKSGRSAGKRPCAGSQSGKYIFRFPSVFYTRHTNFLISAGIIENELLCDKINKKQPLLVKRVRKMFIPMLILLVFGIIGTVKGARKIRETRSGHFVMIIGLWMLAAGVYLAVPK